MRIYGPSQWKEHFLECPEILLDGKPIKHVTEADDVEGYVIVEVQDDDGLPKVDEENLVFITERLFGVVTFNGPRREAG